MICPFCDLDLKRNPIISRGSHIMVIPSNPSLVEGHILIVPRRHVENISDLNYEELLELVQNIKFFQDKILKKFSKGCDIRQHYRPFEKESETKVNHLHFHLLPRDLNDELYEKSQKFEKDIFKTLSEKEASDVVEKYRG